MVVQRNPSTLESPSAADQLADENRLAAILELRTNLRSLSHELRTETSEDDVVSSSISALDAILPDRGLRQGTLSEWIAAEPGGGTASLVMRIARQAQREGPLIIVDRLRQFYAPALAASGTRLSEVILVRPQSRAHELWAIEQSLKCPGVGAVLSRIEFLKPAEFRRLQLAAESGTAVGLLLRPKMAQGQSGWADIRLLVSPRASPPGAFFRRVAVQCVYAKGGLSDRTIELDICDETSAVRLAAELSDSATEQ